MAGCLRKEVKDEVNKLCSQAGMPANTVFTSCLEILEKGKAIFHVSDAKPALFFTHPKNRSGLGLSPHTAHRNGAKILAAGADRAQCQLTSYAFEMQPPGSPERVAQVDFNTRLIARSKGLLAPPSGEERYLTVGAGHTVSFCKAVAFGCETPQPEIKAPDGKLDRQKIFKNEQFRRMVETGWNWVIFPAELDIACPKFAHVAQQALNASNHVASLVGELEAAQMLSECLADCDSDDDSVMEAAVETVRAMGAPCSHYASSISAFVTSFGGGTGAHHIKFIDDVAKEFHVTCTLGEGSIC